MLIGVQKCGTTTLYAQLVKGRTLYYLDKNKRKHFIVARGRKEKHYYDHLNPSRGDYLSLFPKCSPQAPCMPQSIHIDPTPNYISVPAFVPLSTELYGRKYFRNVRLIVLLRDPVARFQSAFYHAKSDWDLWGKNHLAALYQYNTSSLDQFPEKPGELTYADFVEKAIVGMRRCVLHEGPFSTSWNQMCYRNPMFLGMYKMQIDYLLSKYKLNQLIVVSFEWYVNNPHATMVALAKYLSLSADPEPPSPRSGSAPLKVIINSGSKKGKPADADVINANANAKLRAFYDTHGWTDLYANLCAKGIEVIPLCLKRHA